MAKAPAADLMKVVASNSDYYTLHNGTSWDKGPGNIACNALGTAWASGSPVYLSVGDSATSKTSKIDEATYGSHVHFSVAYGRISGYSYINIWTYTYNGGTRYIYSIKRSSLGTPNSIHFDFDLSLSEGSSGSVCMDNFIIYPSNSSTETYNWQDIYSPIITWNDVLDIVGDTFQDSVKPKVVLAANEYNSNWTVNAAGTYMYRMLIHPYATQTYVLNLAIRHADLQSDYDSDSIE